MLGCVEQCKGCDYVAKIAFTCFKLVDGAGKAPAGFWRRGTCPYATHLGITKVVDDVKVRVGQQKQKKVKR